MDDELNKIRQWLVVNDVFNISSIARRAEIPKAEMYHFLKDRRELPERHYDNLKATMIRYGYKPLNNKD